MNILVSSCLLGMNCRYNGVPCENKEVLALAEKYHIIPVCPEIFGGLPTPRQPSERYRDKVTTRDGLDVTTQFESGAAEVLRLAKLFDCKIAVLKERSPSCGSGMIYDGTFQRKLISGDGICAEALKKAGIRVIGESQLSTIL